MLPDLLWCMLFWSAFPVFRHADSRPRPPQTGLTCPFLGDTPVCYPRLSFECVQIVFLLMTYGSTRFPEGTLPPAVGFQLSSQLSVT